MPPQKPEIRPSGAETTTTARGRSFEDLALEWLRGQARFRLLARGYRRRCGELDLVLEQEFAAGSRVLSPPKAGARGLELVFVEVRAREGSRPLVGAIESVDARKRRRLKRTAEAFLAGYRGPARSLRFDVLAWEGGAGRWIWLKDVRMDL